MNLSQSSDINIIQSEMLFLSNEWWRFLKYTRFVSVTITKGATK